MKWIERRNVGYGALRKELAWHVEKPYWGEQQALSGDVMDGAGNR